MQLIHNEEQITIEKKENIMHIIFTKVDELIEQENVIFSHLLVDGVEVYEDHETYIQNRLNDIMEIKIITRTSKEMIWETMQSIHEYMDRAIPALQSLVDESYDGFTEKTWQGIDQLAEGMQWITQFITFTKTASEQPPNWSEIVSSMRTCEASFKQLLEAVEAKDQVLISDILAYEIIPAYESLENNIAISLQDKEYMKYVN